MPRVGLLVSLFVCSTLLGCFDAGEEAIDTADTRLSDSGLADCAHDPPLSYDNFGRGYLRTHCAGCHSEGLPEGSREGAPVGVDLDTWAGALTWAERTEARATGESPTMPPAGGPTPDERLRFEEWVRCELLPAAAEGL